jgi:hypothetical protein
VAGGVFCDLVIHKGMLSTFTYYGITGKAKLLFESYIRDRYQRVQITNSNLNPNTLSQWAEVKHGVRQWLILGPLLFLLYVSVLPTVIKSEATCIFFADDTSRFITSPNTTELQNNINIVFKQMYGLKQTYFHWIAIKLILLNLQIKVHLQLTFTLIMMTSKFIILLIQNFLDFINDISWKIHIEHIIPKLSSASYAMK